MDAIGGEPQRKQNAAPDSDSDSDPDPDSEAWAMSAAFLRRRGTAR